MKKLITPIFVLVLMLTLCSCGRQSERAAEPADITGIIRAISDKADDSEEMSYEVFKASAAARCAAIVRNTIASM